jgi:hypothetical protein
MLGDLHLNADCFCGIGVSFLEEPNPVIIAKTVDGGRTLLRRLVILLLNEKKDTKRKKVLG